MLASRPSTRTSRYSLFHLLLALCVFALPESVHADSGSQLYGSYLSVPTGQGPFRVAIGDFNRDGKPDMAVTNSTNSGSVSILLGNGDGTFAPRTDLTMGTSAWGVAAGDFNGDGMLDLAVTNGGDNTVSILLGHGDGSFAARVDYVVAPSPLSIASGDFNGDGNIDLALVCYWPNVVSVLLGAGDGTFSARTDYAAATGPYGLAISDFNGDGHPDLAVGNYGVEYNGNTVSVLLGRGDGTFAARADYQTMYGPRCVATGDFNGDGSPDLAVGVETGFVSVLLGNGDGTFAAKTDYRPGRAPRFVACGDLDGDGKLDLVTSNTGDYTASVLLGTGDGAFTGLTTFATDSYPSGIAIGDLNGDGEPDLAIATMLANTVSVFLHTADGPTATLVELFRAMPTTAGIRVEWELSNSSMFLSTALERGGSDAGPWEAVHGAPELQGQVTSVLDADAAVGREQWYRLRGVQLDGGSVTLGLTSAVAQGATTALALSPLSPNPSTGRSVVTYALPRSTNVRLTIADVQGREVAVLADGVRCAGRYTATFEAGDLRPGMYFVRFRTGGVALARRFVLVK